jgi:hypothetical protein
MWACGRVQSFLYSILNGYWAHPAYCLLHSILSDYWAHPAYCPLDNILNVYWVFSIYCALGKFRWCRGRLTTLIIHLHLVLCLIMSISTTSQVIHITCKGESRHFCSVFCYEVLGGRNLGVDVGNLLGMCYDRAACDRGVVTQDK